MQHQPGKIDQRPGTHTSARRERLPSPAEGLRAGAPLCEREILKALRPCTQRFPGVYFRVPGPLSAKENAEGDPALY